MQYLRVWSKLQTTTIQGLSRIYCLDDSTGIKLENTLGTISSLAMYCSFYAIPLMTMAKFA